MCFACKQAILSKTFTATIFLHREKSHFCSCRVISAQNLELLPPDTDSWYKATAWIPVSFLKVKNSELIYLFQRFIFHLESADFERFQARNFPRKHLPVKSLKSHQTIVHETKPHAPRQVHCPFPSIFSHIIVKTISQL